jgi:hypothetical protein
MNDKMLRTRPAALVAGISSLMKGVGFDLPPTYLEMLRHSNGFALQSGVVLYASEDVLERNKTFEVDVYAPDYFAIGDDSGGRLIVISKHNPGVWIVDGGSLDPQDMTLLAPSLEQWFATGCGLQMK